LKQLTECGRRSNGLINISASDSIPDIWDTLAPTRWQRIGMPDQDEGFASGG
jgi:hypothetical protein